MTVVAHRWPLVFDRVSPLGHALARRLRYHWQSPRTVCGVSVSSQTLGRRFDPEHERACPVCRGAVGG